jgi:hypothetical protein
VSLGILEVARDRVEVRHLVGREDIFRDELVDLGKICKIDDISSELSRTAFAQDTLIHVCATQADILDLDSSVFGETTMNDLHQVHSVGSIVYKNPFLLGIIPHLFAGDPLAIDHQIFCSHACHAADDRSQQGYGRNGTDAVPFHCSSSLLI